VAYTLRNLPDHVALVYAPLSREKFVGFAKLDVATGEINIWSPTESQPGETESSTPDPSSTSPNDTERSSPDATVPGAAKSHRTGGGPASVPTA